MTTRVTSLNNVAVQTPALTPRTVPGPKPIKNIFALLRLMQEFNRDTMGKLSEWLAQYGDIYLTEAGSMSQYVTSRPDYMYEVLLNQVDKFRKNDDYTDPKRGMARFTGNGILTSDGEFWKKQRKLVSPAFHAKRIGSYAGTTVDYTVKMLNEWHDGQHFNIAEEMTRLTMDIVARTLFNVDVSAEVRRVEQAVATLQQFLSTRTLLPTWVPTPLELRARKAVRDLDEIVYRIIREWRAKGEDRGDLLSMLLMAQDDEGNHMTDKQARDEAVTLFLAGHETTANLMNWTWYLLAQNPEAEAKLHQEVDTVLAGRAPTLADLEKLPYVEQIIKESMRLYPPAWGVSREATADVEIDGYKIPKGSIIGLMIYQTHRDPRWWSDPEKFEPTRFSPENEKRIPRYAYLPFGGGPRICIGNSFAQMEARLILATVASRYRLTIQPGQKVEMMPRITLNAKGGIPMTAVKRQPVLVANSEAVYAS